MTKGFKLVNGTKPGVKPSPEHVLMDVMFVMKDDAILGQLKNCYVVHGDFDDGDVLHGTEDLAGKSFYIVGKRGERQLAIEIGWTITAKDGLLWRNGKQIPLPEADEVARKHGFQHA